MKWLTLFLLLLLAACSTSSNHNAATSTTLSDPQRSALENKSNLYLSLLPTEQDKDGFLTFDYCDSLLFTGLIASTTSIDLTVARDSNGMWHRKPIDAGECWDGSGTSSTISRDMLIGVLWYAWENKRLDIAEDLFAYGEAHNWVMGQGDISRTYMTPGLQATLADLIYALGGKNHLVYRNIPQLYTINKGFEAHLDALSALLRAQIKGEMDAQAFSLMNTYYNANPNNALFSYVYHKYGDGDQSNTVSSLLNEQWFPPNRLPASSDRCEAWLWQRDFGPDWQPCSDGQTHSGGDFLFVAGLLLKG